MCQMNQKESLIPSSIMESLVDLFPIMVHKVTLGDGSRRVYEIAEATGSFECNAITNTLFQYDLKTGNFQRTGAISDKTALRLLLKGADEQMVAHYKTAPQPQQKEDVKGG